MKKKETKKPPIFDNNQTGEKESIKNRKLANEALKDAKKLEKTFLKSGYIWVKKDKIAKLIHPNKLNEYKEQGYN